MAQSWLGFRSSVAYVGGEGGVVIYNILGI
jgi:hypothetical protein